MADSTFVFDQKVADFMEQNKVSVDIVDRFTLSFVQYESDKVIELGNVKYNPRLDEEPVFEELNILSEFAEIVAEPVKQILEKGKGNIKDPRLNLMYEIADRVDIKYRKYY